MNRNPTRTRRIKARRQAKFNSELLSGIDALKHPFWHELNKFDGRNDRMLHVILCCYAKHHLDHPDFGWTEIDDMLFNVICNEIGDDRFCKWADLIREDRLEEGRRSPRVTSKRGIKRKKR